MSFIGKFFAGIFIFFATAMLFIMLFRLNNNNNGAYIGLSDIYMFFKNNPIDVFDSFKNMFEEINSSLKSFKESFIDFSPFTSIWSDGFEWYETFTIVWEGFKYLFNITINLSNMILLPFSMLFYLISYIFGLVVYIFQFFNFIITF